MFQFAHNQFVNPRGSRVTFQTPRFAANRRWRNNDVDPGVAQLGRPIALSNPDGTIAVGAPMVTTNPFQQNIVTSQIDPEGNEWPAPRPSYIPKNYAMIWVDSTSNKSQAQYNSLDSAFKAVSSGVTSNSAGVAIMCRPDRSYAISKNVNIKHNNVHIIGAHSGPNTNNAYSHGVGQGTYMKYYSANYDPSLGGGQSTANGWILHFERNTISVSGDPNPNFDKSVKKGDIVKLFVPVEIGIDMTTEPILANTFIDLTVLAAKKNTLFFNNIFNLLPGVEVPPAIIGYALYIKSRTSITTSGPIVVTASNGLSWHGLEFNTELTTGGGSGALSLANCHVRNKVTVKGSQDWTGPNVMTGKLCSLPGARGEMFMSTLLGHSAQYECNASNGVDKSFAIALAAANPFRTTNAGRTITNFTDISLCMTGIVADGNSFHVTGACRIIHNKTGAFHSGGSGSSSSSTSTINDIVPSSSVPIDGLLPSDAFYDFNQTAFNLSANAVTSQIEAGMGLNNVTAMVLDGTDTYTPLQFIEYTSGSPGSQNSTIIKAALPLGSIPPPV